MRVIRSVQAAGLAAVVMAAAMAAWAGEPGTPAVATDADGSPAAVDATGDMTGDPAGDAAGDVTGDATGDVTGDASGDVTGDATGDAGVLQGLGAPPASGAAVPTLNQLSVITARERQSGDMLTITNHIGGVVWHIQGGPRNEDLTLMAALNGRQPLWGNDYWLNSNGDFRPASMGLDITLINLTDGVVMCCNGAMSLTFDIVSMQ